LGEYGDDAEAAVFMGCLDKIPRTVDKPCA
jgi:hypothetical protein